MKCVILNTSSYATEPKKLPCLADINKVYADSLTEFDVTDEFGDSWLLYEYQIYIINHPIEDSKLMEEVIEIINKNKN